MNKRILAGFVIAAVAIIPAGGHTAGPEGCAIVAGEGQASDIMSESAAGYSIIGGGSFKVLRARYVDGNWTTVTLIEREHAVPEAVLDADIQAGDVLGCQADQGFVVAGKAL